MTTHQHDGDESRSRDPLSPPAARRGLDPMSLQMFVLQRTAGNRAVSQALTAQRYRQDVSVSGMGSSSDPSRITFGPLSASVACFGPAGRIDFTPGMHVDFDDGNGRVATLTLPEGVTSGRVSLNGMVSAKVVNMLFDDHPFLTYDGLVPFSVVGDSVVFGAVLADSQTHNSGATASVVTTSGQMPGGGYVTFAATMSASGSSSMGGGIGLGPVSGSAPMTTSTNYSGGASRSFTVNLRITPPRPIPGPDVDFKVGRATLADGQEGAIANWFRGLPAETQDAIRNGRRTVTISGYASTTAKRHRNRDLSEQRAHVVERILRGFAGSGATLNIYFFGEDNTPTPDEREDPRWRRTTIVAQAPTASAPGTPGPVR